eukprot:ANDGO_07854.mRNA.1 Glycoprotein 3-alpha-L-fucosyltransferase A
MVSGYFRVSDRARNPLLRFLFSNRWFVQIPACLVVFVVFLSLSGSRGSFTRTASSGPAVVKARGLAIHHPAVSGDMNAVEEARKARESVLMQESEDDDETAASAGRTSKNTEADKKQAVPRRRDDGHDDADAPTGKKKGDGSKEMSRGKETGNSNNSGSKHRMQKNAAEGDSSSDAPDPESYLPDPRYKYPSIRERVASRFKVLVQNDVEERYGYKYGYRVLNQRILPAINEYPSYEAVEKRYADTEKHRINIVFKDCCSFLGSLPAEWQAVKCAVPCYWSSDESKVATADGVFFHIPSFGSFPTSKPSNQYWIAGSMESDKYYGQLENPEFLSRFDFEASYRLSSEVPLGYGSNGEYLYMSKPKPKVPGRLIMYVASNCGSRNGRDDYVAELMKHIKVDSFGKCVHSAEWPPESNGDPFQKWNVMKTYKFYLAFENSNSEWYQTEKFHQPLDSGTVPIVMGDPYIDDFSPSPTSVISVKDFPSAKDLAEYLHFLDENEEEYNKYLAWKTEGPQQSFVDTIAVNNVHSQCRMCLKIHDLQHGAPPPERR